MRRILAVLALLFVIVLPLGVQHVSALDPLDSACSPAGADQATLDQLKNSPACQRTDSNNSNPIFGSGSIIERAITLITFITGVASIILIIISGIKFVTSRGDPGSVSSAKGTIAYALVGLVVSVLARAIIIFVVNRVK